MQPLFSKKYIKQILSFQTTQILSVDKKKKIIQNWQQQIQTGKIDFLNETQLDITFLNEIFGEVLGYQYQNPSEWNLEVKPTFKEGRKIPDAILGFCNLEEDRIVRAVIELKGTSVNLDKNQNRKDFKGTPVEQAFSYVSRLGGKCDWVIVSNFIEIRLYHSTDMYKYQSFQIVNLLEDKNFELFCAILSKNHLFLKNGESRIDQIYQQKRISEEKITTEFYQQYKDIREVLFFKLVKNNINISKLVILTTTQKIIDRVIFMCFARDIIPMFDALQVMKQNKNKDFYNQSSLLWNELKTAFNAFDLGIPPHIPTFNGGLFKTDTNIENLKVEDVFLMPLIDFVLKYDFESELNVTLLGHIFEQSITDLEILRADIESNKTITIDKKRKKDGIFYTPDYITRYLIQQSVGTYLEEKKQILLEKYGLENLEFWQSYQQELEQIKIIDPACGSGAFLVQVYNFLWQEWQILENEITKLTPQKKSKKQNQHLTFDNNEKNWYIKKKILQNNIFGVDLNSESVNITKLALWLLTANRFTTLADLSENIKQGNSLIDDKNIDEKAFDWNKEFKFSFDVVVGNPPYVQLAKITNTTEEVKNYLTNKYQTSAGRLNTFVFFIHWAMESLKKNGYFSFIIPNTILTQEYYAITRQLLLEKFTIKEIVNYNFMPFEGALVENISLIAKKQIPYNDKNIMITNQLKDQVMLVRYVNQSKFLQNYNYIFQINDNLICEKINHLDTFFLKDFVEINQGIALKGDKSQSIKIEYKKNYYQLLDGKNIQRYQLNWSGEYLEYDLERIHSCKRKDIFQKEKLLFRRVSSNLIFTYDNDNFFTLNTLIVVTAKNKNTLHLKYLLAILNSKLINYYYVNQYKSTKKIFSEIQAKTIGLIPIFALSQQQQQIYIDLVDKILLENNKFTKKNKDFFKIIQIELQVSKYTQNIKKWYLLTEKQWIDELKKQKITLSKKQIIEWLDFFQTEKIAILKLLDTIQSLENHIDNLVYQLYNITENEINIIKNTI